MQVQQAGVTNYEIQVPLRLCHSDSPDVEAVFALVRQSHTQQNMLTPATKMFTFESSEWTAQNLQHLASHGNSYILLGEAGMQCLCTWSKIALYHHCVDVHACLAFES